MSFDKKALDNTKKCCNSHNSSEGLQPKDELCLSAYVDGECGWFKRIFAQRTLSRSFEARKFVDELERTSDHIQQSYSSELRTLSEDISLWPRISARIAQEERLTLLRSIPVESGSSVSWAARLSWSGLGAVAASILMVIYLPISSEKKPAEFASNFPVAVIDANTAMPTFENSADQNSPGYDISSGAHVAAVSQERSSQLGLGRVSDEDYRALQLASLQGNRSSTYLESKIKDPNAWRFIQQQPQFIQPDDSSLPEPANGLSLINQRRVIAPQVFEVDWVRSNGRVRVLQDPSGKAAIIWVNRPRSAIIPSRETRSATNAFVEKVGIR